MCGEEACAYHRDFPADDVVRRHHPGCRWHTTVWRRTSRCSTGLVQNAENHRWAHSASKQPTYESAYTNPLLQAHCSQLSKCALASVISAKTQHSTQEMEEERERGRVSWKEAKSQRKQVCILNICCQRISRN